MQAFSPHFLLYFISLIFFTHISVIVFLNQNVLRSLCGVRGVCKEKYLSFLYSNVFSLFLVPFLSIRAVLYDNF